jgi:hypothetical protein
MFFQLAQDAIIAHGGRPADSLESGPFIVTARRLSGAVTVYDLTRAPQGDYGKWIATSVGELSDPLDNGLTIIVIPPVRDQVRAFVFGSEPDWERIVNMLIPGFSQRSKS